MVRRARTGVLFGRSAGYTVGVTHMSELKSDLRSAVRASRLSMGEDQRDEARSGLTRQLRRLALDRELRSLSCFLPRRSEPDTRPFLEWARHRAIDTLLPSSRPDGRLDWIRPSGAGTVPGAHGIDEPLGERLTPLAVEGVDAMLIPAAAVDLHGNRLGWGQGYFDRSLSSMANRPPVFAVVFDEELVNEVPFEPHDVPITGVVTPERVLTF